MSILLPPHFKPAPDAHAALTTKLVANLLISTLSEHTRFHDWWRLQELRAIARKNQRRGSEPIPDEPPLTIRKPARYLGR